MIPLDGMLLSLIYGNLTLLVKGFGRVRLTLPRKIFFRMELLLATLYFAGGFENKKHMSVLYVNTRNGREES
jgi:hypothetical protein